MLATTYIQITNNLHHTPKPLRLRPDAGNHHPQAADANTVLNVIDSVLIRFKLLCY